LVILCVVLRINDIWSETHFQESTLATEIMKTIFKNIISFILPVTVLIIVPIYIEPDISIQHISALVAGLFIMCFGLYIITLTISLFIRIGKGTLAPWSPTRKLVIHGLYRHVRNPMIIGVLVVLIGESTAILSLNILIWAIIFFIINNLYFVIYEEPSLKKRFGEEYQEYKKNVPRWILRLKPFEPESKLK
jgi:protein-S-isoprenylcysteine O-methyltransferase Ste14